MGNIETFHGTGVRALPYFDEGEDLFGVFFKHSPNSSGILTDSLESATVFAVGAQIGGKGKAIIVEFNIPGRLLKLTERSPKGFRYYYTEDWVQDPQELPRRYLENAGFTVERAIRQFASGEIAFYRVRHEFVTGIRFPKE